MAATATLEEPAARPAPTAPAPTAAPVPFRAAEVLALQRSAGNRAVTRTLRPAPGGPATRPLPVPAVPAAAPDVPGSLEPVVGRAGMALLRAGTQQATRAHALAGGLGSGRPLSRAERDPLERSFGHDLGHVRLHDSETAGRLVACARARALTLGDHVLLGRERDEEMLAHEVAHTLQSRLSSAPATGRLAPVSSPAEREAARVAPSAARGEPVDLREPGGDDPHAIPLWTVLLGGAAALGAFFWATSPSPEENQQQHAAGEEDESRIGPGNWIALLPIYGSIQQIRHAESYFQRVLGVGFLALDMVSLGTGAQAARALVPISRALWRVMLETASRESAEAAGIAALRPAETATAAAAQRLAAEGGSVVARETAQQEIAMALESGMAVVVTQGATNHAVLYAKNAAGQILRVHGSPTRLFFEIVPKPMDKAYGLGRHVHAYAAIELQTGALSIEQAVKQVGEGGAAVVQWLKGTPTSCGIVQGAVLEAMSPASDFARYLPRLASERLLPVTILEHQMATGVGRIVEGGKFWIAAGTLATSGAMLGTPAMGLGISLAARLQFPGAREDGAIPIEDDEELPE